MSNTQSVQFDTLRSLGGGSITSSYVAVGAALTRPARLICITNNTDGDVFVSTDASTNMLFIAKNTFKLFDLCTNRLNVDQMFVVPNGTQFYTKQSSSTTTGALYIEIVYGVLA